mgnify:CR=1 FL=1
MRYLILVIGNKAYSSWSLRPWLLMQQAGIGFDEIRVSFYEHGAKQKTLQYCAALVCAAAQYAGAIHALPAMQEWVTGAHAKTAVNPQYES